MWVETDTYIGPDRRSGRAFRLLERRGPHFLAEPPSLATLVRQLRRTNFDLATNDDHRRFRLRLAATIDVAAAQDRHDIARRLGDLLDDLGCCDEARAASDLATRTLDAVATELS